MKALNHRSCLIYVEKRTGRLHLNFKVSQDQTRPVSQQLDAVRKRIGMEWLQFPVRFVVDLWYYRRSNSDANHPEELDDTGRRT